MKQSESIILDTVKDGTRYVLRRDKYNWIWQMGSPELDDEIFLRQTRNSAYYTSFEFLLCSVLKNLIREGIIHIDTESILTAHQNALTIVSELGEQLDKVSWGCLDRGMYCPHCFWKLKSE